MLGGRQHGRRSTSTSTSATAANSNGNDSSDLLQPSPLTIIPEAPPAALDVEAEALAPEQLLNAAGGAEEAAAAAASVAVAFEVPLLSSPSGSAVFAPPSSPETDSPPPPPPSPPRPPPRDLLRPMRLLASLLSPDRGAPAPFSVSSSSLQSSSPSPSSRAASASASASSPPTSFSLTTLSTDSDDEGVAASSAATAAAAAAAVVKDGPPLVDFAPVDFEAAAAFGGSETSSVSAADADSSPFFAALPLAAAVATPPLIAEAPDVPAATANAAVANSSSSSSAVAKSVGSATSTGNNNDSNNNDSNEPSESADLGNIWGLGVLGLLYVHHSTTGFALPALLPLISPDLSLTDVQGSLLTAGYTVLYALALIPVGLLADRADRPRMLAGGAVLWSLATIAASRAQGFGELLALRVGFAAAQATQNPICFSLIPELFPRERNTAMAAYNAAIYVGRALSFAAVIVAGRLGMGNVSARAGAAAGDAAASAAGDVAGSVVRDIGVTMVPLDKLDLSQVSLLYTQGEKEKRVFLKETF